MRTIGRPGKKNICTLSSHRATRELYAKLPSHRAPVRAVCEGSMRIELRSELYEKGALCGPTGRIHHFCIKKVRGLGLVTGFSNIDYLRTGNQQQRSGRSGYQLFYH